MKTDKVFLKPWVLVNHQKLHGTGLYNLDFKWGTILRS